MLRRACPIPCWRLVAGGMLAVHAALAAADDCNAAHEMQRRAQDLAGRPRVTAFEQVVRLCPDFNALYNLGRAYQEAGDRKNALRSFDRALAPGGSELRFRAFALARRAEVLCDLDQLPEALVSLEQARQAFAGQEPDWFVDVRRKIDSHPQRDRLSEQDIGAILGRLGRDIAVVPRLDLRVPFEFGSASLTPEGARQVAALGRALARLPERSSFQLVGHTDLRGTPDYNQRLSERRAGSVLDALVATQPGLRARLQAQGAGLRQPLYTDPAEESQRLNRRVEVRVAR